MAQEPKSIAGPVSINIVLGAPDRRRRDCSNYIKAIEDLLVSYGCIEGDDSRFVKSVTVSWATVDGAIVQIDAVPS